MSGRKHVTPFDGVRRARFTDLSHSEVELIYAHEGPEHDADNGKRKHVYYNTTRYRSKQAEHGTEIYPEPTPHSL